MTGIGTVVQLSATSVDFGNQKVGVRSAAQSVTLRNRGTAGLTISGISTAGPNSGDFGRSTTCPVAPAKLATGASCTISVTFKPTATGPRQATVNIADNGGGSPQTISLRGTGTP